jgi:uncharacterized membrane protein
MGEFIKSWAPRIAWPIIYLVIFVLLVFSTVRTLEIINGASLSDPNGFGPPAEFTERYNQHPVVSLIHMLTGMLFVVFGPLQFSTNFRNKNLTRHRWIGRTLITAGLIAAITGILAGVWLPAFGGFNTLLAVWFFGLAIIGCLLRSFWCARNRMIHAHREWMMRAFAIGLGVGTQRILIFIFLPFQLTSFEDLFGATLWMGIAINLIIAEVWINVTRKY